LTFVVWTIDAALGPGQLKGKGRRKGGGGRKGLAKVTLDAETRPDFLPHRVPILHVRVEVFFCSPFPPRSRVNVSLVPIHDRTQARGYLAAAFCRAGKQAGGRVKPEFWGPGVAG